MEKPAVPLFSVIIPVYNIEGYLRQCADSVLEQGFRDFELIFVDDGSTDGCAAICDRYAENDRKVRVIHKKNGGLSSARNAGIESASGTYLLFVDGDDFIDANALEKIASAIKNDGYPDVLFLNAFEYYEDARTKKYGHMFKREEFYGRSKDEVLALLSSGGQFHVSACVKAIKRELIDSRCIRFTNAIIGEDVDFSIELYLNADTYSYCDEPYYYYRQNRSGSIMSQKSDKRYRDLLFIIEKWVDRAKSVYLRDKEWIFRFLFHQYYLLVALYKDTSKSIKTKQTRARVKQLSYLLKYTENKKAYLLFLFYKAFGINPASYLIYLAGGN